MIQSVGPFQRHHPWILLLNLLRSFDIHINVLRVLIIFRPDVITQYSEFYFNLCSLAGDPFLQIGPSQINVPKVDWFGERQGHDSCSACMDETKDVHLDSILLLTPVAGSLKPRMLVVSPV